MGEEDWNLVIDTHLRSAFNVARASLQLFLDQNDGAYVFFTSTAGIYGEELLANYAAAKSGVIAINKVLTLETAGTAIRTNVIAPQRGRACWNYIRSRPGRQRNPRQC